MKDFKTFLRREIADLEQELERDPLWRKLQKLRATLEEYEGEEDPSPLSQSSRQSSFVVKPRPTPRPMGRQPSELRLRALDLVEKFLQGRPMPTKTKEIHDFLVSEGVDLGGKEPASNLSALLYHSKRFVSHGRAGWTNLASGEPEDDEITPEKEALFQDVAEFVLADLSSEDIMNAHGDVGLGDDLPTALNDELVAEAQKRLGHPLDAAELDALEAVSKATLAAQAYQQ